jgi:hypothetical protein
MTSNSPELTLLEQVFRTKNQQHCDSQRNFKAMRKAMNLATTSTKASASTALDDAIMPTPAKNARKPATDKTPALPNDWAVSEHPKYFQGLIWDEINFSGSPTASWTELQPPLPTVPTSELKNHVVNKIIIDYPHLFKIVMPIKVDVFRKLLMTHPNQPFIESICKGLTEGFWPWADTKVRIYLDTWDEAMA